MAQSHSEQRNCSTTPRTLNGIIRRSDEWRKGHRWGKVAIQTSPGACVQAATRISNRIANINTPKPRSMASLFTSGFSKSSRRTNSPPQESGEVHKSHRTSSVQLRQPKERRALPSCQPPPTGRQARPSPLWVATTQPTGLPYRVSYRT